MKFLSRSAKRQTSGLPVFKLFITFAAVTSFFIWWNIREWTDESPCRENRMRITSATLFYFSHLSAVPVTTMRKGESTVLQ